MVLTLYLFVNSHNKIMIPWEGHFCIEFPFADNKCWNVQLVFSFEQGHWMSMIQYNESSLLQSNGQLQLVKLFLQWSLPPHNEPKRSYWVIKVNTHHFSNWSVYFRVSKCILHFEFLTFIGVLFSPFPSGSIRETILLDLRVVHSKPQTFLE